MGYNGLGSTDLRVPNHPQARLPLGKLIIVVHIWFRTQASTPIKATYHQNQIYEALSLGFRLHSVRSFVRAPQNGPRRLIRLAG